MTGNLPPMAFVGFDDGAELGLLVTAILAVAILAALWLILDMFAKAFRRIPIVGPPIARALDWSARWARGTMMATWHGTLWALGKVAHGAWVFGRNMVYIVKDTLDAVGGALEHQSFTVIPREIRRAKAFATKQASRALVTALQYADHVAQEARRLVGQERYWRHREIAKAKASLLATIKAADTDLLRLIDAGRAAAAAGDKALAQQLHRDIAQARAAAVAGDAQAAAAAVATALHRVDGEAAGAAATIWAGIDAEAHRLAQQLGTDFWDVGQMLRIIPTIAPVTMPAVVAAGLAGLPPLLRLAADCTVPTCRDLGQLRQLTHTLASDAWMAALLAWLIYCFTEPAPAAADTAAVIEPIAAAVMDPLLALLRVA